MAVGIQVQTQHGFTAITTDRSLRTRKLITATTTSGNTTIPDGLLPKWAQGQFLVVVHDNGVAPLLSTRSYNNTLSWAPGAAKTFADQPASKDFTIYILLVVD